MTETIEDWELDSEANTIRFGDYGIDGYSRFVEVSGERLAIEPFPFLRLRYLPFDLIAKVRQRADVVRWWWATRLIEDRALRREVRKM